MAGFKKYVMKCRVFIKVGFLYHLCNCHFTINIMYVRTGSTMAEAGTIGLVHTSRARNPRIIDP